MSHSVEYYFLLVVNILVSLNKYISCCNFHYIVMNIHVTLKTVLELLYKVCEKVNIKSDEQKKFLLEKSRLADSMSCLLLHRVNQDSLHTSLHPEWLVYINNGSANWGFCISNQVFQWSFRKQCAGSSEHLVYCAFEIWPWTLQHYFPSECQLLTGGAISSLTSPLWTVSWASSKRQK